MTGKNPNDEVEIVLLPDETGKAYSGADKEKIERMIRERLLPESGEPYYRVQVEVKHRPDGTPVALLVSMLRASTYTADIVKVNVKKDFQVTSIERSPKEE